MELLTDAVDSSLSLNCEPDSLPVLNDDCLHQIFSYIVNIRERLRLMRVCRRFARLIVYGLKTDQLCLSVANLLYPSELNDPSKQNAVRLKSCQLFDACHRIFEFHNEVLDYTYDDGLVGFSGLSVNGLSYVIKLILRARYTRKLFNSSWTMESLDSDSAEFKWILTRCPQLETLCVYDFHLDSYVLNVVPNTLVDLHLIDISLDLKDFENFLESHGNKLRVFRYSRRTVIPLDSDRTIVKLIADYCSNLESLDLHLSYPELNYFGSFKNLRYLSMEGCGRSLSFYEYIFGNCPNLSECKLTFKEPPNKDILIYWRCTFPELRKIKIEIEKAPQLAICPPPVRP